MDSRIAPDPSRDLSRSIARNRASRNAPKAPATPPPPQDIFKSMTSEKTVKISFLPQDPGMLAPKTVEVDGKHLQDGLVGPRVRISEPRHFPTPHPDADGNYIYTPDDPRFDAAQTYACSTRALHMAEKYLGRDLPWGFTPDLERQQLLIHPHAGSNVANAFYSSESGSLNFFSFTDPKTGEILRTGESADVVSHETGHALLDAIRHSYINSLSVAAGGFHESFGDMTAMLAALHDDSVIEKLRDETSGDLRRPNLVAKNAEMLGTAISHLIGSSRENDTLRTAINNYKYADQHFYPFFDNKLRDQGMGQEPHAYSNLFTGTFYDVLTGLYDKASQDATRSFKSNVVQARDQAGKLLFRAVEFAPIGDPSYKNIALAFLKADDVDNGGSNRDLLAQVFTKRKLLTPQDITKYDERQKALPKVKLDVAVKDEESAMQFLDAHREDLGVSKDVPLEFVETHSNRKGETYIAYGFNKDLDLDTPDFGTLEGAKVRAKGGLLLAFDGDGKMLANNFDDVTRRDEEDIKDHLKVSIANGALSMQGGPLASQSDIMRPDGTPYLHVVQTSQGDGSVLQRSPVIWG